MNNIEYLNENLNISGFSKYFEKTVNVCFHSFHCDNFVNVRHTKSWTKLNRLEQYS